MHETYQPEVFLAPALASAKPVSSAGIALWCCRTSVRYATDFPRIAWRTSLSSINLSSLFLSLIAVPVFYGRRDAYVPRIASASLSGRSEK
jgi:hypothetical protein